MIEIDPSDSCCSSAAGESPSGIDAIELVAVSVVAVVLAVVAVVAEVVAVAVVVVEVVVVLEVPVTVETVEVDVTLWEDPVDVPVMVAVELAVVELVTLELVTVELAWQLPIAMPDRWT